MPGYTGGYVSYNEYSLKEDGFTYSGVQLGDSFDEVVMLLGAPQYHVTYDLDISPKGDKYYIYYDLNPESENDYPDGLRFNFSDGVLREVLLRLYIFDK
ncbi:MAG: hypothetical protein LBR76_04130 [Oscillospiraceae bacterium]|nr:hypothetical protein [Oscillospiraceae bacterium]